MKKLEDYVGYGIALANHPFRFYASLAQANAQLSKQYLDMYKQYFELGEKELEAFTQSDNVSDFFTKQHAVLTEAVTSTSDVLNDALAMIQNPYQPVDSLVTQALEERANKRSNKKKGTATAKAA